MSRSWSVVSTCEGEVVRGGTDKTQMTGDLAALVEEVEGAGTVEFWILGDWDVEAMLKSCGESRGNWGKAQMS